MLAALIGVFQDLVYVESAMTGRTVTLKLNQQQLELLDRTIAKGLAADRPALVRLALRELAAKRAALGGQP
jgi:Arc/MetJ-type ribon-helix-helix transcriptional regulator